MKPCQGRQCKLLLQTLRLPYSNTNGGFEADYNWQEANITIPENLFRNEEKNKAGDIGTGILDVFDRYNFTIRKMNRWIRVAVDLKCWEKCLKICSILPSEKAKVLFIRQGNCSLYVSESLIHYLDNALNVAQAVIGVWLRQTKLFDGSADKKAT